MPEVMLNGFHPKKPGRPVLVDITEMQKMVDDNPGYWVQETFTLNEAASVRRQFLKQKGYRVMTGKAEEPGKRIVMVKWGMG